MMQAQVNSEGKVTRTVTRSASGDGSFVEAAQESLSSFEYTIDAKGVIKPQAKAYAASVLDAEASAADALKRALRRIKDWEFN